ncbi:MAG: glycosyltransferase family 2 protein [Flavobacteriales bacterium]|jgi:teichuronic acid biosynthesis glycosyltransferase TuaG|nr:glycosyltransferase family 2 protein [Flavobacteriales bacterium]MBT6169766.1 glycosyltransferase family 2 protein [Flavobacteriaceae bacterium]
MNDLISIITPYYNSSKFIEECVNSVLLQSYSNWELLIVDDCSNDNSKELLLNLEKKDERIKITFLDNNIGAANARNIAIQNATGKYIAFLDSDDLWESQKLDKQISFMVQNDIAFSYTSYQSISEDRSDIIDVINAPDKMTYHDYLKNTIIGCLTVVIDREKIGDFEMPNISSSHDMALWLLIMKRGFDAYGLNENLAKYRIVSTSNTANKWRAAKDVWKVYRQFEKLSFLYSVWCFLNYAFNAIIKRI